MTEVPAERDIEFRCRQLLTTRLGLEDPRIVLVEEVDDRLVVLFNVRSLTGPVDQTAFIEADGEITTVLGHVF